MFRFENGTIHVGLSITRGTATVRRQRSSNPFGLIVGDRMPISQDAHQRNPSGASASYLYINGISPTVVGPISFIGFMAPHLARWLGCRGTKSELIISAMTGALIMLIADWCGRNLAFPYQLPAGLLASIVDAAVFLAIIPSANRV